MEEKNKNIQIICERNEKISESLNCYICYNINVTKKTYLTKPLMWKVAKESDFWRKR